jgi:hypothetical protein
MSRRAFRLDWSIWRPVAAGIERGAIIGAFDAERDRATFEVAPTRDNPMPRDEDPCRPAEASLFNNESLFGAQTAR